MDFSDINQDSGPDGHTFPSHKLGSLSEERVPEVSDPKGHGSENSSYHRRRGGREG